MMYEDNYIATFGPTGYEKLKAEQKELDDNTEWEKVSSQMLFSPLDTPMDVQIKFTSGSNRIPYDLLADTAENAKLLLHYDGKEFCVRDCAMASIERTTKAGEGVMRADKDDQADILTRLMKKVRGESQVLIRAGKASAILSTRYEYMPITKLLEICDSLQDSFGEAEFLGGEVNHALTVAQFRFPKAAHKTTIVYNAALAAAGRTSGTVIPVVEFRSSDTSGESATLYPYLQLSPGHLFPIGEGIKVPHIPPLEFNANTGERLTCMEKFQQEAATLFAKLEYDIKDLIPKMLNVKIDYPANTFIGLCKYAGVPQKWGGSIEEEIRLDWPNGSDCTFLDIYECLTQATAYAIRDGLKPHSARILTLEEGISKVARNPHCWRKYDLPGTVAWSQNISNR